MILSLLFTGAVSQLDFWLEGYPYWDSGQIPQNGGSYSYCDIANNAKVGWPVNSECNNAGTCVIHNPFQQYQPDFTWGKCQCADPATEGNFVYDDPAWNFQLFSGDQCTETSFKLFGTISYLISFAEWDASPGFQGKQNAFECAVGSGPGVEFNPANPLEENAAFLATPDLTPMIRAVIEHNEYWDGDDEALRQNNYFDYWGLVVPYWGSSVESQHCRVCSNEHLCGIGNDEYGDGLESEGNENGGWLKISFATNYNTYYSHECEKTNGVMPIDQDGYTDDPPCPDNNDDGNAAQTAFHVATFGTDNGDHHKSHFLELTTKADSEIVYQSDLISGEMMTVYGMNWDNSIQITRTATTETSVEGTSTNSLRFPSMMPTLAPSPTPTEEPTSAVEDCFNLGYTHSPSDLKFKGVAQSGDRGCRWGLETSWPGGDEPKMCDSPYVVCLPEANTPNVGFWTNQGTEPYQSDTATYTVEMCKRECAYDQRCTGFEFWAEGENAESLTGKCSLIDDIPIEIGTSADSSINTEGDLDGKTAADFENTALCWEKDVDCNPYFGEDDLSEIMLNCYCPNNRKGFYTKNVKRTVSATRFCGADGDGAITRRIREAQANRMFHLCENWCLFNTQDPRTESWYHDPWEECWREQYAGVGTHRSYCYRVIRDPFTIEQYFIDNRAANMCAASDASKGFGNNVNTPAPVIAPGDVTTEGWYLAPEGDSCDDICESESLVCNNADIMTVLNGAGNIEGFMNDAGYNCNGNVEEADTVSPNGSHGWALPAIGPEGQCITRHEDANKQGTEDGDLFVGCNVAIGVGYQRLCACGTMDAP